MDRIAPDMDTMRHTLAYQSDYDIWDYVASSEVEDRYGDVIVAKGWDIAKFRKNNIALWNHSSGNPIGNWTNVRLEDGKLLARLQMVKAGISSIADMIRGFIEERVLKAVSVGFLPRKYERIEDEKGNWTGGFRYTKSELLEISVVSVPANPEALSVVKSLGFQPEQFGQVKARSGKTYYLPLGAGNHVRKSADTAKTTIQPEYPTVNLSERIAAKKAEINDKRNKLTELSISDNLSADDQTLFEELPDAIEAMEKNLASLERAYTIIAKQSKPAGTSTSSNPDNLPAVIEPQSRGMVARSSQQYRGTIGRVREDEKGALLVRSALVMVRAFATGASPEEVIRNDFGSDKRLDTVVKAVTTPATTVVDAWAGALVGETIGEFLDLLRPDSVFFRLQMLNFTFGNSKIRLPSRQSGNLAGDFVAEAQPIPVKQLSLQSVLLEPRKLAVITTLTEELARMSAPAAEPLLREMMIADTRDVIDVRFLDNVAGNQIRPPGLQSLATGQNTRVSSGTDLAAVITDLRAAMQGLAAYNMGKRPVWIMNTQRLMSLSLMTNAAGNFMFKDELATGVLLTYPVLASTQVPANVVFLVDAAELAAAYDDSPELAVSREASLHMEGAPSTAYIDPTTGNVTGNTAATVQPIAHPPGGGPAGSAGTAALGDFAQPIRSLFQTWCIGLRLVWPMTWISRRVGAVQTVTGVTW